MTTPLDLRVTLSANASALQAALRQTNEALRQLQREGEQSRQIMSRLSGAMGSLKSSASFLATAGIAGLGAAFSVRDITLTLAEFDRLNASLKTVTGSLEGAQRASSFLRSFATETPYELSEVTEAFIRLRSLGLDASERAMRSMGNTASAMGTSLMQFIEAVADASTGEFERLKEFGIRAGVTIEETGNKVKFTFRGVTTTVANDAQSITEYLLRIGETDFASGMADQMETIGGKLSNLQDAFSNFVDFIGNLGIRDALKKSFEGAADFIQTFQKQRNAMFGSGLGAQRDFYEVQLQQSRRVYNQLLNLKKTPLIGDLLAPNEELAKRERDLRNLEETVKTLDTLQRAFDKGPPASPAPAGGGTPPPDKGEETKRKREAEAAAREARQAALAEIEARLRLEEDASRREEEILKGRFDRNLIGYRDYYTRLAALRQQDIDHQIAAKQAELQLTSDRGEHARILAEINILTRERESIGPKVAQEQADAEKELADQLEQVRLRLAELTGTEAEKRQAQTDQLRARYKELIEALKAQGDTAGIELVDKLINAEAARDKFDELSEFGKQAARNIQSAFADFLFDPFDEGLEGMAEGFANTLRRMIAEATSRQLVEALFGQFKNASSGDSTGFMGFLASIFSFHSGGIVGRGGTSGFVPALAFAGAPRLHTGGWIKPGEVPIVAKVGEEVLTENDPRHIKNFRGGPAVEVHIHEAPGTQARTEAKQESGKVQLDIMIEQIEQRLGANINRGGGLAPTIERRYGLNRAAGAVS